MPETKPLIDVQFAITQLGGNSDLLKRMLNKFSSEFLQVPQEIKDQLAAGEIRDAKMKVHTTKGLSGNLGMLALFDCSKKLDQQLREDEINQETLDQFADLMTKTCDFIQTIDLEAKEQPAFSQQSGEEDYKEIFLQRLQRHEFIDDEILHQYVDSLSINESQKLELVALVEELQYEKAISIIDSL